MKKLIFGLTFLGSFLFINGVAMAQESLPGTNCQWKRASCGLFSGTYEACLVNGDGMQCNCGDITRNC